MYRIKGEFKMKRIIILGALLVLLGATAHAAEEEAVRSIPIGTQRIHIHTMIGEPDSDAMGYRETYALTNGKIALLGYNDEALDSGFIIAR